MGCILCILEYIIDIITTTLLMIHALIQMLLYNLYNSLSVFCQMCSVLPICFIFMVTSSLKCYLCKRSNICCVGTGQECPIVAALTTLLILYFVFYAFGALDSIFEVLGYVKANNKKNITSTSNLTQSATNRTLLNTF